MDSVAADTEHSKKLLEIYQFRETVAGKQDKRMVPRTVLELCDKTFKGGNDWSKMPMGSAYFVQGPFARKSSGV